MLFALILAASIAVIIFLWKEGPEPDAAFGFSIVICIGVALSALLLSAGAENHSEMDVVTNSVPVTKFELLKNNECVINDEVYHIGSYGGIVIEKADDTFKSTIQNIHGLSHGMFQSQQHTHFF